jgi:histidinol dehydrogenase
MIPILKGIEAGRDKLSRARTLDDKTITPALADKIRAAFGQDLTAEQAVSRIIAEVRARGDDALREWTTRLDGVDLPRSKVSDEEIDAAVEETPAAVREALQCAANRIRAFHEKQKPRSWLERTRDGGALGQIIQPLQRVGIYVPGGSAPLPSSLLMAAIPAQVAGVGEIVVTTPPSRDGQHVAPVILAAARIVQIENVFSVGGAQAIAALAYGTRSIPRADKIVGAGGLFTTLAKRQVFGTVGIDGLYGPTETLLLADESANPAWVAADLLAQAEHDVMATSILVTTSSELAYAVRRAVEGQLASLARRRIIEQSLAAQGAIIVVQNRDEALELANSFAPEHLCLLMRDAWSLVRQVRNAAGVFVGEWSSEALGDYVLGPSHIMPTMGTARFGSPLNVNDFLKITNVMHVSASEAPMLSATAQILAEAEGLTAHANAVAVRMR